MHLTIQSFHGKAAKPYKSELAQLRIKVFREYPYLYDGNLAYENEYLNTFMSANECIIVLAFDGDQVVGASTGMPLKNEPVAIQEPWINTGEDVERIFYLSESVLLKPYRSKGLGVQFFEEREKWAKQLGYEKAAFCGVIRPDDHPLKPIEYIPLDQFWINRGFSKKEGCICKMSWKEITEENESEKELLFWYKDL